MTMDYIPATPANVFLEIFRAQIVWALGDGKWNFGALSKRYYFTHCYPNHVFVNVDVLTLRKLVVSGGWSHGA